MYVPDRCPSCGSKKHWTRVSDNRGKPTAMNRANSNPVTKMVLMPYKVGYKVTNAATLGTLGKIGRGAKKAKDVAFGNGGVYYCKKCGLKMDYRD